MASRMRYISRCREAENGTIGRYRHLSQSYGEVTRKSPSESPGEVERQE